MAGIIFQVCFRFVLYMTRKLNNFYKKSYNLFITELEYAVKNFSVLLKSVYALFITLI